MSVRILHGDCREQMASLDEASVDAIVTDPPYELGFMGKGWDSSGVAFAPATWEAALRVLKPGGHLLAFSGTRTYHRMVCAIEDAGFEIRDQIGWLYGSGFPKSLDVSKAIDKKANEMPLFGAVRSHIRLWRDRAGMTNSALNEALGFAAGGCGMARHWTSEEGGQHSIPSKEQWRRLKELLRWEDCELDAVYDAVKDGAERPIVGQQSMGRLVVAPGQGEDRSAAVHDITAPATDAARQWQGWGTALKPAWEPIVMARKPLRGTVAANVLAHGTGALNIDACRIATDDKLGGGAETGTTADQKGNDGWTRPWMADEDAREAHAARVRSNVERAESLGRWPANIIHDGSDEVLAAFPEAAGQSGAVTGDEPSSKTGAVYGAFNGRPATQPRGDSGSAARFFYCAKADAADRAAGLATISGKGKNTHPTVKPTDLMRYLCRLVTPPGGVVLDPFMGSGSTLKAAELEGFSAIGIELSAEYIEIARRRIASDAPLFAEVA